MTLTALPRPSVPFPMVAAVCALGAGAMVGVLGMLGLVAVGALCAIVSFFIWPWTATAAVVFAVYANVPSVLVVKYGLPPTAVVVVPALLLLPVTASYLRKQKVVFSPMFALLLLYFAIELASTAQSAEIGTALTHVQTFMIEGLFIFFCVTNAIRTRLELERASVMLLAAASFLGFLTLVQGVTHHYYGSYGGFARVTPDYLYGFDPEPRLAGPIGDPNYFAQVMLIAVPIGLLFGSSAKSQGRRFASLAAAGLALAGIVLSYSRGAVLALLIVLI